ncbi:UDP-galactopyranose mutase [Citrobacter farmeri]
MGEISVKTGNNARNGGKNSLNRLIRCVCGKKIGPDPRNFNQRVSLGRNDLLIRTFPKEFEDGDEYYYPVNDSKNNKLFSQYRQLSLALDKFIFGGRLAEYKYYDMHQVIASALRLVSDEFS